jgi:hypothetical protein
MTVHLLHMTVHLLHMTVKNLSIRICGSDFVPSLSLFGAIFWDKSWQCLRIALVWELWELWDLWDMGYGTWDYTLGEMLSMGSFFLGSE